MTNNNENNFTRDLPRVLNLFDATSIVIGAVIGSGIFLVPAIIAQEVQSFSGIVLVWVAAGIISLFGSISYAELSSAFPGVGGQYVFLRDAYNPFVGFLFGWTNLVLLMPGSFAVLSVAFRDTLETFINLPFFWVKIMPTILIVIMVIINYRATKWGADIQNGLTVMKVGTLLFIIGAVVFGKTMDAENFTPILPQEMTAGQFFSALPLAMIPAFWAYNGWHRVSFNAGEIRNAKKVIPQSLFIGTILLILLYVFTNLSYISALSVFGVAKSTNVAADTIRNSIGAGQIFMSIAILISITGALANAILTEPRITFAMSRDGLFFSVCGWVHPRFDTPAVAILISAALGIVLSFMGNFRELLTSITIFNLSFIGLSVFSVFRLRKKFPHIERPYRVWGYPVVPLLFAGSVGWVILSEFIHVGDRTPLALLGLGLVLLGIPAYYFWKRKLVMDDSPKR